MPRPSARTHHRSWAYGRICWAQPIGDSHDSQETPPRLDESPAARSTNATARIDIAAPMAAREPSVNWAQTAAMPANAMPAPAMPAPSAIEPATGGAKDDHEYGDQRTGDDVQADRDGERRGDRCEPADHTGPDELEPTGLLLGAGVADDGEHARHRRDHRRDAAEPPRGQTPGGRRVEQRPVQCQQRRVGADRCAERLPGGHRVVEPTEGVRRRGDQRGDCVHPHGEADPVAPADQLDESRHAHVRRHRAPAADVTASLESEPSAAVATVVPEEELFERGRLTGEAPYADRGDQSQHGVQTLGVDLAGHPGPVDDGIVHARHRRQLGRHRAPRGRRGPTYGSGAGAR